MRVSNDAHTFPCSLVGQDIRLSPERPGFESRRGKMAQTNQALVSKHAFFRSATHLFSNEEKKTCVKWKPSILI